jgi:CubicO group peptidase (beta-lactamase class C family)
MTFPGASWQQATPETLGVDSELEAAFAYLTQHVDTSTTAVVRNGYLIRSSAGIDSRFGIFSVTKSFTSTVLGLVIDDGKASLSTLAKDHVAVMATLYPTVNLAHFATMTSGYDALGAELGYDTWDGGSIPSCLRTPCSHHPHRAMPTSMMQ